jgi:hypothetical protein
VLADPQYWEERESEVTCREIAGSRTGTEDIVLIE